MRISKVRIRNFRCLQDVEVRMDDTVVVLGPNNCGKSAFLDALRYVFSRRAGQRNHGFVEYDFYMPTRSSDPRESDGIQIDVQLAEERPDEWPVDITNKLDDIVQTDPVEDIDCINLRVSCAYNVVSKSYEPHWQFLSYRGEPLGRRATYATTLTAFLQFVPMFYLSALRDVAEEFSARSQFWGRILRSVEVPLEQREEIEASLERLNADLLQVDPRIEQVTSRLETVRDVIRNDGGGAVSIRALPLKMWDLMSRSEVIVQGQGSDSWFPLSRHGQGVQSLSVLFLFQAFVDHLLASMYEPASEPILALEEPEAHLHPQAARALWEQVKDLGGQKIVTTHSPYFVQHVPFSKLRLFRRDGCATKVYELSRHYEAKVPYNQELFDFCQNSQGKYTCSEANGSLRVYGEVTEDEFRAILRCYSCPETRGEHIKIRELKEKSIEYIPDNELDDLQTYVRRIRGEVLFAHGWLMCEGPSDYIYLQEFATMMGTPFDSRGISLIDYQNNGSPGAFAALARVFGFRWHLICDGDGGGCNHIEQLHNRGFSRTELEQRVVQLPADEDTELFLIRNGFREEMRQIALGMGASLQEGEGTLESENKLVGFLRQHKTECAVQLTSRLRASGGGPERIPPLIADLINEVTSEVQDDAQSATAECPAGAS